MGKPQGLRGGDFTEQLAFNAFSYIGFVASVPRESDLWLVDQIVQIAELKDQIFHPIGIAFNTQIKSNLDPIRIGYPKKKKQRDNEISAFHRMGQAYFITTIKRDCDWIAIYSTIARHIIPEVQLKKKLRLMLSGKRYDMKFDGGRVDLHLGPPIYEGSINKLRCSDQNSTNERERFRRVLSRWATFEMWAHSFKQAQTGRIPLVPEDVPTGEVPSFANVKWHIPTDKNTLADAIGFYWLGVKGFLEHHDQIKTTMHIDDYTYIRSKLELLNTNLLELFNYVSGEPNQATSKDL